MRSTCIKRYPANAKMESERRRTADVKTELNKLAMKRPIIGNDNGRVVSTETLEMADADALFRFATTHQFGKFRLLAAVLEGAGEANHAGLYYWPQDKPRRY